MPVDPGPHDLDETRVILSPDGAATTKRVTPTFYAELDQDFGDFRGHLLVQRGEFSEAWPTWEMHPHGDEVVTLLDGDVDFVLMVNGGEQVVRLNRAGSYVIVPRGTWHTARPHETTTLLFLTPGAGTLNRAQPEC